MLTGDPHVKAEVGMEVRVGGGGSQRGGQGCREGAWRLDSVRGTLGRPVVRSGWRRPVIEGKTGGEGENGGGACLGRDGAAMGGEGEGGSPFIGGGERRLVLSGGQRLSSA
jgi:hypothetical protein